MVRYGVGQTFTQWSYNQPACISLNGLKMKLKNKQTKQRSDPQTNRRTWYKSSKWLVILISIPVSLPPVWVRLADDVENISFLEGQAKLSARHVRVIWWVIVEMWLHMDLEERQKWHGDSWEVGLGLYFQQENNWDILESNFCQQSIISNLMQNSPHFLWQEEVCSECWE